MNQNDGLDIAFSHYEGLRKYLGSHFLLNVSVSQRAAAREKLTRLTRTQFFELSTDVTDEMNRRIKNSPDLPFLAVKDEFHPKRNQARQKLATLHAQRFKDLASDVFSELERRFSQVVEMYLTKYGDDGTFGFDENLNVDAERIVKINNNQNNDNQSNNNPNTSKKIGNFAKDTLPPQKNQGLDSLLADLGSFARGSPTPNSNQNEKLLLEKISTLEAENNRITLLQDDLMLQRQRLQEVSASHDNLGKDFDKLKREYAILQEDYNSQQQIANDIRLEATNLLEEIKALQKRNENLARQSQDDAITISRLKEEIANLRSSNMSEERPSPHAMSAKTEGSDRYNDDTLTSSPQHNRDWIDPTKVDSYENAVDELLKSTRSDTPTSILVAMKAIVLACKNISEEVENYDASPQCTLSRQDRNQLKDLKQSLSGALTGLMNSARNFATNFGNAPISSIENPIASLSEIIYDMINMVSQSVKENNQDVQNAKKSDDYLDIEELKNHLEKQTDLIVQAIQTLLGEMRSATTFGPEFKNVIQGITSIVSDVITVSRNTLTTPAGRSYNQQGEHILADLKISNEKLESLGDEMIKSPQNKAIKQKMAASSYEIAKFVKDFISLLE